MSALLKTEEGTSALFERIEKILLQETGVVLGKKQHPMMASRLARRLSELGINQEDDYLTYIDNHLDTESKVLVSLLTTHHTYFFREFSQFEFLAEKGLAHIVDLAKKRGEKNIKVWSAACSRGQEAYSLAMFLSHHLKTIAPDFTFEIYGSDVCEESVQYANNGVYLWNELKSVPALYLSNHWAKGTGEISNFVKAKPSIKNHCKFELGNLMTLEKQNVKHKFDLIFCRNVFIYFSKDQIQSTTKGLLKHLHPGGYLFIGTTESLIGYDLKVELAGPSIYQEKTSANTNANLTIVKDKPIRVLCVDDSPVILSLLKRILTTEYGFEIVATAKNGFEAAEQLKKHQVDAMTLDIHMPELNGTEYLERNFSPSHPPVIMITSVSREDKVLATKSLELGASDFVEKPDLSNLNVRADEIRSKIWHATKLRNLKIKDKFSLDKSFSTNFFSNNDKKLLVVMADLSERDALESILSELKSKKDFPSTVVFFEGNSSIPEIMAKQMNVENWNSTLKNSKIYFSDFKSHFNTLKSLSNEKKVSILVLNDLSKSTLDTITSWKNTAIYIEEKVLAQSKLKQELLKVAKDIVPVTSFIYLALKP